MEGSAEPRRKGRLALTRDYQRQKEKVYVEAVVCGRLLPRNSIVKDLVADLPLKYLPGPSLPLLRLRETKSRRGDEQACGFSDQMVRSDYFVGRKMCRNERGLLPEALYDSGSVFGRKPIFDELERERPRNEADADLKRACLVDPKPVRVLPDPVEPNVYKLIEICPVARDEKCLRKRHEELVAVQFPHRFYVRR